jgi:glycosyltransferase involved in cell wall biosynthesis
MKQISSTDYDIVLSPGSIPVSRLHLKKPLVIWSDSTFACYVDHYGSSRRFCEESLRAGHNTESIAYKNASLLLFASEWAAESAIKDYRVADTKVKVVPFGANFINVPDRERVLEAVATKSLEECEIISIGVDWYRKGMGRTIELAGVLNSRGIPTKVTIIGCQPPSGAVLPGFVKIKGFVDKRNLEGEKQLTNMFLSAHFHVLLSKADAFGVVFAEANAHGIPNITLDVGGIGAAVVNGRGGHRFDPEASLDSIADFIEVHMQSPEKYRSLASKSLIEFEERLNWDVIGRQVRRYLEGLIN